jgi:hypothetical protein
MKTSILSIALGVLVASVLGCGDKGETSQSPRFDAKAIAAETDRGNLAPLTELNKACTEEVEKNGKRMANCSVQDEVGKLTKPLSVRF